MAEPERLYTQEQMDVAILQAKEDAYRTIALKCRDCPQTISPETQLKMLEHQNKAINLVLNSMGR